MKVLSIVKETVAFVLSRSINWQLSCLFYLHDPLVHFNFVPMFMLLCLKQQKLCIYIPE